MLSTIFILDVFINLIPSTDYNKDGETIKTLTMYKMVNKKIIITFLLLTDDLKRNFILNKSYNSRN